MRIALDAMGGDKAPLQIVAGALGSLEQLCAEDTIILVGPEATIRSELSAQGYSGDRVDVVDAPDIIRMDDPPIESLRKKPKSSIGVLAKLAKRDQADAVISAGNTGACVAAFQMRMRNLPNVNRPGIAAVFPFIDGPVTVCDVGANIACKPINLHQYALMASIYSKHVLGIEKPRVGMMSIGQEDSKGNEIIKKARDMLRADEQLHFIGNIEGRDIFQGVCDVAVCDGFVGNVILKLTEGAVDGLFRAIKHELAQESPLLGAGFKSIISRIYKKYDYNEYGGAPLLGVNGTAVICHGSSEARTIKNAILSAKKYYTQKVNDRITRSLSESCVRTPNASSSG